jgi:hypothetical protein
MAESFRPERRPINPAQSSLDDVASPPPVNENQKTLQNIQNIREAAAKESGKDAPHTPGIQISGKVPPQFMSALQNRAASTNQPSPQATPRLSNASPMVTTTGKLETLIKGIQEKTRLYEEITLPSKGKFYDGQNGPRDGKIHIRPMTGEEEQVLATPRFVKRGQAINMIFNRCIQECAQSQFDSANFLSEDRTYILIYLRGISYTPNYDVEVKCPSCDRKFAYTIDLSSIFVDNCPDNFGEANLVDTLPTTGYKFRYRLANGNDDQMVQDYRDRRMKGFDTSGQADDTLLYRTALMVEEIEGLTDKHELQSLLKALPINDVAYLRNIVNEPPFGVDTIIEIPCPACLQDFSIDLPLEANFFFPRGKKKASQTQV